MLELITLKTLKAIFDSCSIELSTNAQSLYIQCLMLRFSDLEATEENCTAFELLKSPISYERNKEAFYELHKCNLIRIEDLYITFLPAWRRYIDLSSIKQAKKDVSETRIKSFIESQSFVELVSMNYKIDIAQTKSLIDKFAKLQSGLSKFYNNQNECKVHFLNWVKFQIKEEPKTTTKSKGKILGT